MLATHCEPSSGGHQQQENRRHPRDVHQDSAGCDYEVAGTRKISQVSRSRTIYHVDTTIHRSYVLA